jgi:hypothetical protein
LEINSSPGLEGIERATKKDVAGAIIQHAEHFFRIRQHRRRKGAYENPADVFEEERGVSRTKQPHSRNGRVR